MTLSKFSRMGIISNLCTVIIFTFAALIQKLFSVLALDFTYKSSFALISIALFLISILFATIFFGISIFRETGGKKFIWGSLALINLLLVFFIIFASGFTERGSRSSGGAVKAGMQSIEAVIEANFPDGTFSPSLNCNQGIFSNETVRKQISLTEKYAGQKMVCGSTEKNWAMKIKLLSGDYWCKDSSGFRGVVKDSSPNGFTKCQ